MAQSLWTIPDVNNLRLPVTVLKEQASALSQQTKGVLVGELRTVPTNSQDSVQYSLDIVVPTLNNYRYRVLTMAQPLALYPLTVIGSGCQSFTARNEQELSVALQRIFNSDYTQRVLASLIAQANNVSR